MYLRLRNLKRSLNNWAHKMELVKPILKIDVQFRYLHTDQSNQRATHVPQMSSFNHLVSMTFCFVNFRKLGLASCTIISLSAAFLWRIRYPSNANITDIARTIAETKMTGITCGFGGDWVFFVFWKSLIEGWLQSSPIQQQRTLSNVI